MLPFFRAGGIFQGQECFNPSFPVKNPNFSHEIGINPYFCLKNATGQVYYLMMQ